MRKIYLTPNLNLASGQDCCAQPQQVDKLSFTGSLGMGLRSVLAPLDRLADRLTLWQLRSRERQALAALDDRALRDVGLSRGEIEAEIRKPFWQA